RRDGLADDQRYGFVARQLGGPQLCANVLQVFGLPSLELAVSEIGASHAPWKPVEREAIGIVRILDQRLQDRRAFLPAPDLVLAGVEGEGQWISRPCASSRA